VILKGRQTKYTSRGDNVSSCSLLLPVVPAQLGRMVGMVVVVGEEGWLAAGQTLRVRVGVG